LGRLVYQAGDYKWALSLVQEAARKLPEAPELMYDLGRSYYAVGRVADAEDRLRSALRAGDSFEHAAEAKQLLDLITLYKDPARAAASGSSLEKIPETDPRYVPALMVSAKLQEQGGRHQEARQIYEKILARNPLFTPATRDLAILYAEHLGDDAKAYDLAIRAREAFPDDPKLARTLGILAYRRSEYARSAQLLKECVQKGNADSEVLYYLGMAHYRLKQRNESREALQQALALNVPKELADQARRVLAETK
jgi:uncharacterized protein HemY